MKTKTVFNPPFQVTTFRDGQAVIIETMDTETMARTRFASAVDLCSTYGSASLHKVELRAGATTLMDAWASV